MEDHPLDTNTPNLTPEEQQARIQALLDRMELEERHEAGQSLDAQRAKWQQAWYLRYVIGPFLAGQVFDLWQWILARVDGFLWGWAEQGTTPPAATTPTDPRQALRKALREKTDRGGRQP